MNMNYSTVKKNKQQNKLNKTENINAMAKSTFSASGTEQI